MPVKGCQGKPIILYKNLINKLSRGEVQSTSTLNNWARYVDKINRQNWT